MAAEIVVLHGELQAPGVAPLRVGTHLTPGGSPTPLAIWDPLVCEGTDVPGRWVAPFPDTPFEPYTLWTDETSGELVRIDVHTAGPHLSGGVTIGSSLAELRAARPDAVSIGDSGNGTALWRIDGVDGTLIVEVATGADYPGLPSGTIVAMSAVANDDPYGMLTGLPNSWYPAYGADVCG